MKKLIALVIVGFGITSCGGHLCDAYTAQNFEDVKVENNIESASLAISNEIKI